MSSVVPEMSSWVGRRKECVGLMLLVLPLLPSDEGCRHPHKLIRAAGAKPVTDPADDLPASLAILLKIGQDALPSEERSSIPWRQSERGQDGQGCV